MITNRYISVAVMLAVLGISMVSAGYHNETEAKEATTTQVVEKARMAVTTEVELQAGIATLFTSHYKEEVVAYAASLSPEEIAEVMSKVSLRQLDAPCIWYNLNGYYDAQKAQLNHMIEMGLSSAKRQRGIFFAANLAEIKEILLNHDTVEKTVSSDRHL